MGGIVIMRYGENALKVIEKVKQKIEDIKPSLPEGVEIVPVYDRGSLIERAVAMARAVGGDGVRLDKESGIGDAVAQGFRKGGLFVIDALSESEPRLATLTVPEGDRATAGVTTYVVTDRVAVALPLPA